MRRRAGRFLVRDPRGAVLLCHAEDGGRGWWFTPGGGATDDETEDQAARRELLEETGIEVAVMGAPVLHRRARFTFLGVDTEQVEWFWHARLAVRPRLVATRLEDYEAAVLDDWRWVRPGDLGSLADPVFPACLEELLDVIDRVGEPAPPWVEEHLHPDARRASLCRPAAGAPPPRWIQPGDTR